MAFLGGFNAMSVEPSKSFEPIPEGKYTAIITASQFKATKSGSGEYLELSIQIVDGPHKGRQLWERLNLKNPNAVAVAIAEGTLSAICRATGVLQPQDSAELHDIPIEIKVVCKRDKDSGEIRNEIKGYTAAGAANSFGAGTAFAPPAQAPVQSAAPPRKAAPWAKS